MMRGFFTGSVVKVTVTSLVETPSGVWGSNPKWAQAQPYPLFPDHKTIRDVRINRFGWSISATNNDFQQD
jgi:hypothetical protein